MRGATRDVDQGNTLKTLGTVIGLACICTLTAVGFLGFIL